MWRGVIDVRYSKHRSAVLAGLLAVAGAVLVPDAWAHHSSAVYDMEKQLTVKGTVTKVMWVNPHAYFNLDETTPEGTTRQWEILLNSPNEMTRTGSDRHTIKVGDLITVLVYPGRGDPTRAFARFATLADGRKVLVTER
jgi:hypothetical protein